MGGGGWILSLDAGQAGRVGREGFWRTLAVAAASAGDPTTLQEVPVGPGVRIWPPPSVLVPLLEEAALPLSWWRGGSERWGNAIPT